MIRKVLPIGLSALILGIVGGPAAAVFTLLHGAGNGMLTVAKGTLPLALFGPAGYGQRTGVLSAPARAAVVQGLGHGARGVPGLPTRAASSDAEPKAGGAGG